MYNLGFSQSAPVTSRREKSCVVLTNFDNGTVSSVGYEGREPSVSGINTSATVSKFTAVATELHKPDVNLTTSVSLTTNNSTVKIMVYKTEISDVALKFEVAGGGSGDQSGKH
jgi:hypothetical protein